MLFNGSALIFTFSGTQVRIAEHERLQSLFKTSMLRTNPVCLTGCRPVCLTGCRPPPLLQGVRRRDGGGWHRLDADDREHAGRPAVRLHPVGRRLPRPAHRGRLPAGDPLEPRQRARESRLSPRAHVASPNGDHPVSHTQVKWHTTVLYSTAQTRAAFMLLIIIVLFVCSVLYARGSQTGLRVPPLSLTRGRSAAWWPLWPTPRLSPGGVLWPDDLSDLPCASLTRGRSAAWWPLWPTPCLSPGGVLRPDDLSDLPRASHQGAFCGLMTSLTYPAPLSPGGVLRPDDLSDLPCASLTRGRSAAWWRALRVA